MEYRVYAVSDATEEELALWLTECSEEKRQRLLQMRREEDRRRSLCADHLARQMLSERCGIPRDHLQILRDLTTVSMVQDGQLTYPAPLKGMFLWEPAYSLSIAYT